MNLHSSRSHAIFTVTVECSEKGPDGEHHVRVGKLHLVDLAVSSQVRQLQLRCPIIKEKIPFPFSHSVSGELLFVYSLLGENLNYLYNYLIFLMVGHKTQEIQNHKELYADILDLTQIKKGFGNSV